MQAAGRRAVAARPPASEPSRAVSRVWRRGQGIAGMASQPAACAVQVRETAREPDAAADHEGAGAGIRVEALCTGGADERAPRRPARKPPLNPRKPPPGHPTRSRRHTKTPAPDVPERGSFVAGGRSARGITSPPRTRRPRAAAWRRPAQHRHPAGPHPRPGRLRHPARPAAGRRCPAKRPAMRH